MTKKKLLGDERRSFILSLLKNENRPLKGAYLAEQTNVSRQVIVNDVTLLKAKGEAIIPTSQGYIYLQPTTTEIERKIVCSHAPNDAEEEMTILVNHGITIKDVQVTHPIYGEIHASIMVSNKSEVKDFLEHVKQTGASYLSMLTDGIHIHTISAASESQLDAAISELAQKGYLYKEN